jgi:AmiR/NasT family two-component response regulator
MANLPDIPFKARALQADEHVPFTKGFQRLSQHQSHVVEVPHDCLKRIEVVRRSKPDVVVPTTSLPIETGAVGVIHRETQQG